MFDLKKRDKLNYKREIRQSKNREEACISDSLHEALLNKSSNMFWKTWNNKVNKKHKSQIEVDGGGTDLEIATKFADYFRQACMPNSDQFNKSTKEEFKARFTGYTGDPVQADQLFISAEAVCLALGKVNKGKGWHYD